MSLRTSGRCWLRHAVFYGSRTRLAEMRYWALFGLTAVLVTVWKLLVQLDKVYNDDFWQAVFGHDPIGKLGPYGLILLALYIVGATAWWGLTVWLFEIGKVWSKRMGLRPTD